MVALSSRFAVLATLYAAAAVYTPLGVDAVAVEARHSDKKVAAKSHFPAEGGTRLAKEPMPIPLPHKLSKGSLRGSTKSDVVEHGRIHKGKSRALEHFVVLSPAEQSIRNTQFPIRSDPRLYRRHHDDDCPSKVIVNGDRDHVRLECHDHDHHDHHDHDDEVVINGDHNHVRTRRKDLQPRFPRHARPSVQRRHDANAPSPTGKGAVGTVGVQGTDTSSGQPKFFGEFVAENQGDHYEIRVSGTNHTEFKMIDEASASQSNNSRSDAVFLEAIIPDYPGHLCCTYDANPSSSAPMRLDACQSNSNGDGHSSQRFGYDPATGRINPMWTGISGSPSNQTASSQASNSSAARRDQVQGNNGNSDVVMVWKASTQNATARVEGTSAGVQTQTVTVTVTAGSEPTSSSAARQLSTAANDQTITSTSVTSASDGPLSTQTARASSDPIISSTTTATPTSASTVQDSASASPTGGLKVEVAPGGPSPSSSVVPSSSTAASSAAPSSADHAIATNSRGSDGIPVREGEVIDTVLQSRYVQGSLDARLG